jgi:hypothetical protein
MDFIFVYYLTLHFNLIFIQSEEFSCMKLNSSINKIVDKFSLNIYSSSTFKEIQITCNQSFSFVDYLQIYSTQRLILDNNLNLTELKLSGNEKNVMIFVYNLVGIDIRTETFESFLTFEKTNFYFFIEHSNIDLFSNGKKILSEADCQNFRDFEKNNFFTHMKRLDFGYEVDFGRNKLCPYLFNNSQLKQLSVFSHTNSYIKKNVFEFLEINKTIGNTINLDEFRFFIIYIRFDTLSTKIINQYLFKNVQQIRVYGYILNIQYDLFKYFNYANTITLNTIKIRTLFHNGNDWLGYLRHSYQSNSLNRKYNKPKIILVLVNCYLPDSLTDLYEYPDEDFCLFSHFPHDKLVFPLIQSGQNVFINCSCTLLFLIQYSYSFVYMDKIIEQIIETGGFVDFVNVYCKLDLLKHTCNFSENLSKCNKSNFNFNTDMNFDFSLNINIEMIFDLLEFLIIVIINPIFSFFGIITNLMVVIVVYNIKNLKKNVKIKDKSNKSKDNLFKHISTHSGFNILFCLISILKLVNECTTNDLFCSSVYKTSEAQWFDIIVIEFIGGLIKLWCNVSYIFINITRLVIMNKKMTRFKRFLEKVSNIRICIYLIFLLLFGVLLNAYKLFQYKIDNLFFDDAQTINRDFPIDKYNFFSCFYKDDIFMCDLFKTLKLINSFINNILFFFITILFDVLLIINLKELVENRKIMVENLNETEEEKKKKKLTKMVIINNIIYFFSHMPEFLLTIILIVFQQKLDNIICHTDFKCDKMNEFTQVFIFISINSQLFINSNFNKVFNDSYRNIILKLRSKLSISKSSQTNVYKSNAAT